MAWTPPTSKWKTQRWSPTGCGNGQCVIRQRFDTLATPRVIVNAGFEAVCGDHDDGSVPVGQIETFQGEWMSFEEFHAWEATFYSWVVWHEIGERTELPASVRAEMQAKQQERSRRVARGIGNLDRVDTDDGPWKPTAALTNPSSAQRAAVGTVSGWATTDGRLSGIITERAEALGIDIERVSWWFEGTGGSRVLHLDSGNQLNQPQKNTISAEVELRFGPDRLVWEG